MATATTLQAITVHDDSGSLVVALKDSISLSIATSLKLGVALSEVDTVISGFPAAGFTLLAWVVDVPCQITMHQIGEAENSTFVVTGAGVLHLAPTDYLAVASTAAPNGDAMASIVCAWQ